MREMRDSGIEWIGEIPKDWDTTKLKYLVQLRNEKTKENNSEIPYVGLEHVVPEVGRLMESYVPITDFTGDTIDYKKGDVLFGKLRPYLAKAIEAECDGRCSSEFWVMQPKKIIGRFLLYSVLSNHFVACINHSTFGVKMPRAEWDFAGNQEISHPDVDVQTKIARYLDRKCNEIDTLIAAKEKSNALLKERRQSIIYESVTKGLNPDVPMKESGIEWIGEIPEGWTVAPLKRLGTTSTGSTPPKANPDYWDGNVCWISSKDLKSDFLLDSEDHITQLAVDECGLTLLEAGTLVFCVRSGILRHTFPATITKMPATINQDLRAMSLKKDVCSEFLLYYLRGMNNTIVALYQKVGATVESIEMEWFYYFPVVLPDYQTQVAIAKYLQNICAEIDLIVNANTKAIESLKEYRQSVIYEAVTGKIEV